MPSACNGTGIVPNPDISGIGVRAAIYAQAVLTLVQPILASIDGQVSEKELIGLHRLYLGILLPGCALLISAIIQTTTQGLSVYHAVIVLQLSWINNTSALIFFQFALIAQIGLDEEREFRHRVGLTLDLLYRMMKKSPSDELREVLKRRAFTLKSTLTRQKKFPQSQDILDEAVQNLSALRAAITDDSEQQQVARANSVAASQAAITNSEVAKAIEMTNQRKKLFRSLGVEVKDKNKATGLRLWWKDRLQTMTKRTVKRFPAAERVIQLLNRDWIMAALASAHLTLFAAFGVWVWSTVDRFGDCDNLTTRVAILPQVNVRVASPLRIWFIVLYTICIMPFLNIIFIGALELLAIPIVQFFFFPRLKKKISLRRFNLDSLNLGSFIVLTLLVQAYFIVTTELTIRANGPLIVDPAQEGNWTFGQTLAVALVAIPLIEVVTQSWEERKAIWVVINGWWLKVTGLGRRLFQRSVPNEVHEMNPSP